MLLFAATPWSTKIICINQDIEMETEVLQRVLESPCFSDVAWSLCLDLLHFLFQENVSIEGFGHSLHAC